MELKEALYYVVAGPIGVGKDTLNDKIREKNNLHKFLRSKSESITFLQEGVNHDPNVLKAYYGNPLMNTGPFEIANVAIRIMLADTTHNLRGIVSGNRYLIEAREVFVRVNSEDMKDTTILPCGTQISRPYMTTDLVSQYDALLMSAITQGLPMPSLVFLLKAPTEVLWQRKETRGIDAESRIPYDYIEKHNKRYAQFERDFEFAHTYRGIKPPRLEVIDALTDMHEDPTFLDRTAERCEAIIKEEYLKLVR